jgi:hypothetical protein
MKSSPSFMPNFSAIWLIQFQSLSMLAALGTMK